MATINVTFTLKKQSFPASAPPPSGNVLLKLMQGGVVAAQAIAGAPDQPSPFNNVADGEYTVTAQRIDMAGQPMGTASTSDPITVVNTVEWDVPDVVSVTL